MEELSKNQKIQTKSSDRRYFLFGLRVMAEITWTIAVPVVILAYLGKKIDETFGTKPVFLILGFIFAALISALTVWRRAKTLGREYQRLCESNGR